MSINRPSKRARVESSDHQGQGYIQVYFSWFLKALVELFSSNLVPVSATQLQKLAKSFMIEITEITPFILPDRTHCDEMKTINKFLAKILFFTSKKTVSVKTMNEKSLMTLICDYILVDLSGTGSTTSSIHS